MSLIGIFVLAGFIFAALAAPLLTPYSPGVIVSGSYAQPDWVTNFPDGYYLSKNIRVVNSRVHAFWRQPSQPSPYPPVY